MENTEQKIPKGNRDKLSKCKDIFDIIHAIFVIGAIIWAAVWFYKQGENVRRTEVTHEITHRDIHGGHKWVHILVNIKNTGKTPVEIDKCTIYMYQIKPLKDKIKESIESGEDIIDEKQCMVPWPRASEQRYMYIWDNISKLLPGETEKKSYEFLLPPSIETIKAFSYVEGQKDDIGTRTVTIYDLK